MASVSLARRFSGGVAIGDQVLLGIPSFIVPPLSMVATEFVHAWRVDHLLLHTGVTTSPRCWRALSSAAFSARVYRLSARHVADRGIRAVALYPRATDCTQGRVRPAVHPRGWDSTVYPKILVAILIVFFPVMVNVLTAVRAWSIPT